MIRTVATKDGTIEYELEYKRVKNINLRIRTDGSVHVSANRFVSKSYIDDFVRSKADVIYSAKKRFSDASKTENKRYFADDEIKDVILKMCKEFYPHFEKRGIGFPDIRFRKMRSQWGNCHASRGILTFNMYLALAPPKCIEYVVCHEFTHFLVQNHSKKFYDELSLVMTDWKERRKELKQIVIL